MGEPTGAGSSHRLWMLWLLDLAPGSSRPQTRSYTGTFAMMSPFLRGLLAVVAAPLLVAGCQAGKPAAPGPNRGALPTMERVALNANTCWFKSGDRMFSDYRLAPELNSFSGRPRILAVPRHRPEALPALVVQAEGNPAKLDAFGPLMEGAAGERIRLDVLKWAAGNAGC